MMAKTNTSDESLVIMLDIDDNPDTGLKREDPVPASRLGIDIEIHLSPIKPDGTTRLGTQIVTFDSTGNRLDTTWADVDFHFSPTASSMWARAIGAKLCPPSSLRSAPSLWMA